MSELDNAVIAKLKKEGKTYEILVDPKKAQDFLSGRNNSIQDVLVVEEIFYDAKKGTKAAHHEFEKIFETDDVCIVAEKILKEGHVPLTADIMREAMEQKKRQIINLIHKNAINPTNGKPHPPNRIEAAITESKAKIDSHKTAEQQLNEIVSQLKPIIPIKIETRELSITIPAQHAGRSYGILKQFGKVTGEKWDNSGSLNATLEIPAGMQEELEISLNNLTKGNVDIKILRSK